MSNEPTSEFVILFVCRANQFRSVIAELLVEQALVQTGDALCAGGSSTAWRTRSAGIAASEGLKSPRKVQDLLQLWDIDSSNRLSRRLTVADVVESDLILTAERAHRSAVVAMDPKAVHRTFTIKQFGRLVKEGHPVQHTRQGGHDLIEHARSRRQLSIAQDPRDDDIGDPIGTSSRGLDACAREIAESLAVFGVWPEPMGTTRRPSRTWLWSGRSR